LPTNRTDRTAALATMWPPAPVRPADAVGVAGAGSHA